MRPLSFDIFCRVVDNFGDIGVCWRLARQLARAPSVNEVRLWVDDLHSFARIQPGVEPCLLRQAVEGVDIVHWTPTAPPPPLTPHDVVIEAFACEPPADFIERMVGRDCVWINLEYLSAEPWVESCHALPSPQAKGLRKFFYFPGFTSATGGLLREPGLLDSRDAWRADPDQRVKLLRSWGLVDSALSRLTQDFLQIALFSYKNAPVQGLMRALTSVRKPVLLLVPCGVCPDLQRGWHGNVLIHEIPFTDQDGFDRLLWSSDLNFVRGEDSLLRAIWAGKPFVWHIYPQEEDAHLDKLQAFLAQSSQPDTVRDLHIAWNRNMEQDTARCLSLALRLEHFTEWTTSAAQWCRTLAGHTDLSTTLQSFCRAQLSPGTMGSAQAERNG